MKKLYIRFGDVPKNGKSKNYLTDRLEDGISVYEAIEDCGKIKILLPSLTGSACVTLSGCLDRPMYEVKGTLIGYGSDGEPVFNDCYIVRKFDIKGDSQGWG